MGRQGHAYGRTDDRCDGEDDGPFSQPLIAVLEAEEHHPQAAEDSDPSETGIATRAVLPVAGRDELAEFGAGEPEGGEPAADDHAAICWLWRTRSKNSSDIVAWATSRPGQDDHVVGGLGEFAELVAGDQHGPVVGGERAQQAADPGDAVGVEPGERLV
jgi:hypothetical protein